MCIRYHGRGMVGIHPPAVTCHFWEIRHPCLWHLLGHGNIGMDHITLHFRFDDDAQGMRSTVGIPNPVVRIECLSAIAVYFSIVSAEIMSVFSYGYHQLICPIQRSM